MVYHKWCGVLFRHVHNVCSVDLSQSHDGTHEPKQFYFLELYVNISS